MSLILHIVRKDFLRLRGRIALWATVLAAKVVHGFALLAGDGSGALVASGQQTAVILAGLDVAVCVVLAVMLVQEDLLVGTRADWLTRPVSGGRLLAAKLTGAVLLFGVLPVVVWLPWWLHCGYGAEQMAWAAVETLGWQLLFIAPAMMMAALTDSLGRFFLWSIVLVGVGIMGSAWVSNALVWTALGLARPEVGMAMAFIAVVMGAVTATAGHYLWRRHVLSLGAGAIGVGAALVAGLIVALAWDEPKTEDEMAWDKNAGRAEGATLAWERARGGTTNEALRASGRGRLNVDLRLDGVPTDRRVAMVYAVQSWRWSGGPVVGDRGWQFGEAGDLRAALGIKPAGADAETESWLAARREENIRREVPGISRRIFSRTGDGKYFTAGATLPRSLIERMKRGPADYSAEVRFSLLRAEVRREVPLEPGAWAADAGAVGRVARVARKEAGAELRWVEARPLPLVEMLRTELWQRRMMRWWRTGELAVIHRAGGDARRLYGDSIGGSARVGTVEVQWLKALVAAPQVVRDGKWVARDPGWFGGARLVVVEWKEEARFSRTVNAKEFLVEK